MTHPNCDHSCTSNCRREGCNCECGEFHDTMSQTEYDEAVAEIKEEELKTKKS